MSEPLRIAVVGVGRIGAYHALHVQELANKERNCVLTAVVDSYQDLAVRVTQQLQLTQETEILTMPAVAELVEKGASDVAVIASRTADHYTDAKTLIDAGQRVLVEKPLTNSLESSREFVDFLNADDRRRQSLMQAFNRRFDEPLVRARALISDNRVGKIFKIVTVLEDPCGPPKGYSSSGLLADMAVHSVDQIMWLTGMEPRSVIGTGARLHNHRISSVHEDFDDAFIQMWLEEDVIAQVHVSRNHVAGYRNETMIYGAEGLIHVGHFHQNQIEVPFEAYDCKGMIERTVCKCGITVVMFRCLLSVLVLPTQPR